ncbi:Gfo/Idh/MocA family protein [Aestuariimicrobium soli]|uniref:Gfo/Idh/MocA family protein n=1 Tax=Aestuariimicrobium soli TaxID=2035834 RepID=UPI003EB75819
MSCDLPDPLINDLFTADAPPEHATDAGEPALRWGVLGPGWVAGIFVGAMRAHTRQVPVAVGSRSLARARSFADEHGIERAHGSYEQLLADPGVDVVYIATPQSEHLTQGLAAIAAGKHVVIEKPFTCTGDEARRLVEAARSSGVFVAEAMWARYLPQATLIRRVLAEGALGDLHSVVADHGQSIPFTPEHRLYQPELGGGALLDLGIYPVQLVSQVFGRPSSITAVGRVAHGVDTAATVVLDHDTALAASTVTTGITSPTPNRAAIIGTVARLEFDGPFYNPTTLRVIAAEYGRGVLAEWSDTTGRPGMQGLSWQQTAFARFIGDGRTESPHHGLDETVAIIDTLDEARRQVLAAGKENDQ